jgi:hypothetical protein
MTTTNTSNSYKIRCDLCEQKMNVQNIIQNGNYWHCSLCYIWLTIKYDSESETNGLMCSNCDRNPIAKKHLCDFTDWCAYCDATLWTTKDESSETE